MNRNDPAIQWLLESEDPSVRYFTLTELLDQPSDTPEVQAVRDQIAEGPRVRALLAGQGADGGFHPYQKWAGAHWMITLNALRVLKAAGRPGVGASI